MPARSRDASARWRARIRCWRRDRWRGAGLRVVAAGGAGALPRRAAPVPRTRASMGRTVACRRPRCRRSRWRFHELATNAAKHGALSAAGRTGRAGMAVEGQRCAALGRERRPADRRAADRARLRHLARRGDDGAPAGRRAPARLACQRAAVGGAAAAGAAAAGGAVEVPSAGPRPRRFAVGASGRSGDPGCDDRPMPRRSARACSVLGEAYPPLARPRRCCRAACSSGRPIRLADARTVPRRGSSIRAARCAVAGHADRRNDDGAELG